ncbi:ArnT family glycosyltransferase [Sutcliffiella halmapala]
MNAKKGVGEGFLHGKRNYLILFSIIAVAFLLRIIGTGFAAPLITESDEGAIIKPVVHMATNMTLNPEMYNRPDHIMIYLNFIILNILSFVKFGSSIASTFQENTFFFYQSARMVTAVIGTVSIYIVYLIGNEFKRKFGLVAAALFAVFPSYVHHSHYVSPDVPITLFTLIIILSCIRFLKTENPKYLLLGTFFCAVNTAEKYPGLTSTALIGIVLTIVALPHIRENFRKGVFQLLKKYALYAGVFIVSLFIVAPFVFLESGKVIEALIRESRTNHLGADGLGWPGNMLFYFKMYFNMSGLILLLISLAGLWMILKRKDIIAVPLFFGAIYFILISYLPLHWERWALPMYVTPLMLGAYGIKNLYDSAKQRSWTKGAYLLVITLIILPMISDSALETYRKTWTDTRVAAYEYSNANGIERANTLFEGYTPFKPDYPTRIFDHYPTDKEYIMLSSSMYNRFYKEPERYPEYIQFYETIKKENNLLKTFQPLTLKIPVGNAAYETGYKTELTRLIESGKFIKEMLDEEVHYDGPRVDIYH